MTKENRGGARKNAGRKQEIIDPVRYEMFIPRKDRDTIINLVGNRKIAAFIREAITEKLNR